MSSTACTRSTVAPVGRLLAAVTCLVVLGPALFFGLRAHVLNWLLPRLGGQRASEWLINYHGGFVRRGFIGELALSLPDAAVFPALLTFQLACLVVVLAALGWFLSMQGVSLAAVVLVASPAGIAFLGWDLQTGIRKEIIGLAVLALLVLQTTFYGRSRAWWLTGAALLLWVVGVLSWEPTVVLLPTVIFLLRRRWGWVLAFSGVSALGGVVALVWPGTPATATAMCAAVSERGFDRVLLCRGGMTAIGRSTGSEIQRVLEHYPNYWGYLPLAVLAVLPLLLVVWDRAGLVMLAACVIAIVPLFVVATDYGRWIQLLYLSVLMALLPGVRLRRLRAWWAWLLTLAYLTMWGIPHYVPPSYPWRYLGWWRLLV